jgi:hypothetical protein
VKILLVKPIIYVILQIKKEFDFWGDFLCVIFGHFKMGYMCDLVILKWSFGVIFAF